MLPFQNQLSNFEHYTCLNSLLTDIIQQDIRSNYLDFICIWRQLLTLVKLASFSFLSAFTPNIQTFMTIIVVTKHSTHLWVHVKSVPESFFFAYYFALFTYMCRKKKIFSNFVKISTFFRKRIPVLLPVNCFFVVVCSCWFPSLRCPVFLNIFPLNLWSL